MQNCELFEFVVFDPLIKSFAENMIDKIVKTHDPDSWSGPSSVILHSTLCSQGIALRRHKSILTCEVSKKSSFSIVGNRSLNFSYLTFPSLNFPTWADEITGSGLSKHRHAQCSLLYCNAPVGISQKFVVSRGQSWWTWLWIIYRSRIRN